MKTHNYGEVVIVREEEQRQQSFDSFSDHRKLELLEGKVKKLEKLAHPVEIYDDRILTERIQKIEKKLDHLAYVVDRTF